MCILSDHLNVLFVNAGQMPFNIAGPSSSSSSANMAGGGNCFTVEQLQLMNHLAQQQRPVYPPVGQGHMLAGYVQQPAVPLSVNSTAVRPQPQQLRGTLQLVPCFISSI